MNVSILKTGVKMSSREIAELTGKLHKNIMADIRKEKEKLDNAGINNGLIFQLVKYKDNKGEMRDQYLLSKDGVMMLAMKYDTVTRYKITQKLNELENKKPKLPQNYKEALTELLKFVEKNEQLELEVQHKNRVIDNITSELDSTLLIKTISDYISIISHKTNTHHGKVYNDIYSLLGRKLNKDIKFSKEKFAKEQRQLVLDNCSYNKEHGLKGEDRKIPCKLSETKANISILEYVVDILEQGHLLIETIAKLAEVGVEDVLEKYNYKKIDFEE